MLVEVRLSQLARTMPELIIQSGKLRGKRLVLPDTEIFIGRDDDCHVRLTSSLISRKHCALEGAPEGLWVRDLGSQNGTLVNDVPITDRVLLKAGDVLQVGAVQFQVPVQRPMADFPPPVKSDKDKSEAPSDADIASWLSDEHDTGSAKPSDTTIIKNPLPPQTTEVELTAVKPTPAPAPTPHEAARRPPRTVKEQAAEIIRRHWAAVRDEAPPSA